MAASVAERRNLTATARACVAEPHLRIVACGERWPDGTLRPCLEDHLAAGGLVSRLLALAPHRAVSGDAHAARCAYEGMGPTARAEALAECPSARELQSRGHAPDVALCLAEDTSNVACRWQEGAFSGTLVDL